MSETHQVREHPILFSGAMVHSVLGGTKTQTRRVVKPQPSSGVRASPFSPSGLEDGHGVALRLPYVPGDRLWVRETFALEDANGDDVTREDPRTDTWRVHYRSGATYDVAPTRWRPSIFMARWASRITLEVISVRVQRVQDISEDDARAEGVRALGGLLAGCYVAGDAVSGTDAVACFACLWDSLNAKRGYRWDANPWVLAVAFNQVTHA